MPSQISFVDNVGALAHYNLLAAIRLFCGGFGVIGTIGSARIGAIGGTRTGTGTLTDIEAVEPAAVTETWTLTCTAAAANGGTFSVSGSVSGAQAAATVGVAYSAARIKFKINDGATDYAVNDTFIIPVTVAARTGTGTLSDIEASPTSVTETWTLTCTAAAADGGTFSVTGSTSGAMAAATVGTPYANTLIKFTINDGATDYAVNDTFTVQVTQGPAAAAGISYDILRYDTVSTNHELIMRAKGLTGLEEIYIGLRTYHDVGADYYNLLAGMFTGYVPGNTFDTQPGAALVGCPAHNNRIDYWLTMNGQRIALSMKVGTPVFEHLYLGKFFPYSRPSQYPYPVIAGGMLVGAAATRFSETAHDFYLRGNSARGQLRTPGGWINFFAYPWGNTFLTSLGTPASLQLQARDTEGQYPLLPAALHDNSANLYGQLDGIFHVSGFNSAVENTLVISGVTYVVMQSVARTGHVDYFAMRLDA
jgi:hypothetical protein